MLNKDRILIKNPLQLYAQAEHQESLLLLQKQWESPGKSEPIVITFFTEESGRVAGIKELLEWIAKPISFDAPAISQLMNKREKGRNIFSEGFLNYLQRFRYTGEIWAVAADTIVLAETPIFQLRAPALPLGVVQLWAKYWLQPNGLFNHPLSLLQIRQYYNSNLQPIQTVIYSADTEPIANFEATTWKDLLQPLNLDCYNL